jgi:hypothetical protein
VVKRMLEVFWATQRLQRQVRGSAGFFTELGATLRADVARVGARAQSSRGVLCVQMHFRLQRRQRHGRTEQAVKQ